MKKQSKNVVIERSFFMKILAEIKANSDAVKALQNMTKPARPLDLPTDGIFKMEIAFPPHVTIEEGNTRIADISFAIKDLLEVYEIKNIDIRFSRFDKKNQG